LSKRGELEMTHDQKRVDHTLESPLLARRRAKNASMVVGLGLGQQSARSSNLEIMGLSSGGN